MSTRWIPERIVIPHDNHRGRYVGRTRSGEQFFITTPFEWRDKRREFVALYLFNSEGDLIEAVIDELSDHEARTGPSPATLEDRIKRHLERLGPVEYRDISVKLFEVSRHGTIFGLVPASSSNCGEEEPTPSVELKPGDYMAFTQPWLGSYDT